MRMAQNIIRYNVVIVGKFFNKGSWVSGAWRRTHCEEFMKNRSDLSGKSKIPRSEESSSTLNRIRRALCVRYPGTPPPHGVRLTSTGRETPKRLKERTNQPIQLRLRDIGCFRVHPTNQKRAERANQRDSGQRKKPRARRRPSRIPKSRSGVQAAWKRRWKACPQKPG